MHSNTGNPINQMTNSANAVQAALTISSLISFRPFKNHRAMPNAQFSSFRNAAAASLRLAAVVPELLRTLVFARPCGGDQFAAGTVSPSLDMSR